MFNHSAGALLVATTIGMYQAAESGRVVQSTTGWCSPVVANITGDVTIICRGVNPSALRALNARLAQQSIALDQKIREAEEWAQKYRELKEQLAMSTDVDMASRAAALLDQGDIDQAGRVLEEMIRLGEANVSKTADAHFSRAVLYELDFHALDAMDHYRLAYQYRPDNVRYALAYSRLLRMADRKSEAANILTSALSRMRIQYEKDPIANEEDLIAVLNSYGLSTADSAAAETAFREALSLVRASGHQRDVGHLLNNLGNSLASAGHLVEGIEVLRQCVALRRTIVNDSIGPLSDLAAALNNLSLKLTIASLKGIGAGYEVEAKQIAKEAVEVSRRVVQITKEGHSRTLVTEELAHHLLVYGSACAELKDWSCAESAYMEMAKIYSGLGIGTDRPERYIVRLAELYDALADMHSEKGDYQRARVEYERSIAAFRLAVESDGNRFTRYLARTLMALSNLPVFDDRDDERKPMLNEVVLLAQNSKTACCRTQHASALLDLARIAKRQGESDRALQDAAQSLALSRQLWREDPQFSDIRFVNAWLFVGRLLIGRDDQATRSAWCGALNDVQNASATDDRATEIVQLGQECRR